MNYSLEQLEEARGSLESRIRGARADLDFLHGELARLVALEALGGDHEQEIQEARRQMVISQQVIDEAPAALLLVKAWIGEVQDNETQARRKEETTQARRDYFRIRKELIAHPELVGRPGGPDGRMNFLSLQLGRDAATGHLFNEEYRDLVTAALEHCHCRRDAAFTFETRIPEQSQA